MESLVSEWLNLLVRWVHLIAGVMWIGASIFFTWMNASFLPPEQPKEGVEGELWMVHGGGFYVVEKKPYLSQLPKHLHWFKWEAMFTMLSGLLLLIMVFYMGGGALMIDPSTAKVSPEGAIGVGIAAIVFWWFIYDGIWRSPLQKQQWIGAGLCAAILVGLAYGLTQVLSGRAAYIHVGAMMGVSMVLNVWVHIIPGQRALVEATKRGERVDPAPGLRGKTRSLHNHYMTYPVLFIMLSNHFPSTYGSQWNWAILAGLTIASALVKHWMNVKDPGPQVLVALLLAALGIATASPMIARMMRDADAATAVPTTTQGKPIDAATAGNVRGAVFFRGEAPPPKVVQLFGGCEQGHAGPVSIPQVAVGEGGTLQDAFVRVASGLAGWAMPPPPQAPVVVDQRACLYAPRVVGARVGQPVTFVNSDPLFHNVRSVATANEPFNVNMPAKDQRETRTFRKPEAMVQARCDVHPWMIAHIGVVEHPWFQVTGDDGAFSFAGLPPGQHSIEVWHEALGVIRSVVNVAAGATVEIELNYSGQGGAP